MLKYEVPNTQIHWQARLFGINNYYFKGVEPQRCTGNLPCHKSNSQPRDINGMRQRRAQPCSSRAPRARAQVMLLGSLTEPPEACEGTVGGCLGLSTVVQCRQLWLRVSQTPSPQAGTCWPSLVEFKASRVLLTSCSARAGVQRLGAQVRKEPRLHAERPCQLLLVIPLVQPSSHEQN